MVYLRDESLHVYICYFYSFCVFGLKYSLLFNQFFRQSIDLYSSVQSPSIGFLGTPTLSRLGSSFLSSSLTRRHTPETLPTVTKPLLDEQHQQQRRSSHALLPPLPTRKHSMRKDEKPLVAHEFPLSRQCSFGQAVLNGMLTRSPPTPPKKKRRKRNRREIRNMLILYIYSSHGLVHIMWMRMCEGLTICDRDMQAWHICFNPVVVPSRNPKTFCLVILNSLFR